MLGQKGSMRNLLSHLSDFRNDYICEFLKERKKIHKYVYDFHGKIFYYNPSQESQKCLQFDKNCHVIAFMK